MLTSNSWGGACRPAFFQCAQQCQPTDKLSLQSLSVQPVHRTLRRSRSRASRASGTPKKGHAALGSQKGGRYQHPAAHCLPVFPPSIAPCLARSDEPLTFLSNAASIASQKQLPIALQGSGPERHNSSPTFVAFHSSVNRPLHGQPRALLRKTKLAHPRRVATLNVSAGDADSIFARSFRRLDC